ETHANAQSSESSWNDLAEDSITAREVTNSTGELLSISQEEQEFNNENFHVNTPLADANFPSELPLQNEEQVYLAIPMLISSGIPQLVCTSVNSTFDEIFNANDIDW